MKKLLTLIAVVAFFASCSNGDNAINNDLNGKDEDTKAQTLEPVADKMLPTRIINRISREGKTTLDLQKYELAYDDQNRLKTMLIYDWKVKDIPNEEIGYDLTEYTFKYDAAGKEIVGWTGKMHRVYPNLPDGGDRSLLLDVAITYSNQEVSLVEKITDRTGYVIENTHKLKIDDNKRYADPAVEYVYDINNNMVLYVERFQKDGDQYKNAYIYTYDNKKSPYININLPGWLKYYFFEISFFRKDIPFEGLNSVNKIEMKCYKNGVEEYGDPNRRGSFVTTFASAYNAKNYLTSRKYTSLTNEATNYYTEYETVVEYISWK